MKKFLLAIIVFSSLPFMALAQAQEKPKEPEEKPENELPKNELIWQHGSIMYDKEQIDWVEKAMKSYVDGIPISTLLPDIFPADGGQAVDTQQPEEGFTLFGSGTEQAPLTAPIFRLDSILYLSADNLSVWLNGKKVSLGQAIEVEVGKVKVVKVTEDNVSMIWTENRIERIFPKWRSHFKALGDSRFSSNKKNIVVDLKTGDVAFILGVNQSLDTASMQVMEGEIKDAVSLSEPKDLVEKSATQDENLKSEDKGEVVEPTSLKNNTGDSAKPDLEYNEDYTKQLKALKKILINNR